jgi:hypothetical protein
MCKHAFDKIGCAEAKSQARYFLNINMSCSDMNLLVYVKRSTVL